MYILTLSKAVKPMIFCSIFCDWLNNFNFNCYFKDKNKFLIMVYDPKIWCTLEPKEY